jgi:effector-binding domain-containing protein
MNQLDVQIVTLKPMRMASAYGFGDSPEEQAWQRISAWAAPRGFLDDKSGHPVFGFNNPNPSAASAGYGYEVWMKVDADVEPSGDIRIIEFMGGTYAVTRCRAAGDPQKNIPAAWKALAAWCKTNQHRFGHHQPLESVVSGQDNPAELVLDLYCPIVDSD